MVKDGGSGKTPWLAVEKPGCEDGWAVGGSHPWNCAGRDGAVARKAGKVVGLEVSSVGGANHPQNSGPPGLLWGRRVHGKVVRGVRWVWLLAPPLEVVSWPVDGGGTRAGEAWPHRWR